MSCDAYQDHKKIFASYFITIVAPKTSLKAKEGNA